MEMMKTERINEVSEMLMPDSKGDWLLKSIPCIVIVFCLIMAFLL